MDAPSRGCPAGSRGAKLAVQLETSRTYLGGRGRGGLGTVTQTHPLTPQLAIDPSPRNVPLSRHLERYPLTCTQKYTFTQKCVLPPCPDIHPRPVTQKCPPRPDMCPPSHPDPVRCKAGGLGRESLVPTAWPMSSRPASLPVTGAELPTPSFPPLATATMSLNASACFEQVGKVR